jgi:hypothetical protein
VNTLLFWLSAALFAGLPPILFVLRLFRGRPAWWLILVAIALVGWASWLGTVVFHFETLGDRLDATENPSPELVDQWADDGGPRAFALLFGWGIALGYAAPWYLVYVLALIVRRAAGAAMNREYLPPAAYRPPGRRL